MKKYLFLFTIGPVQSFIAEARKLIDLHNGSRLFSDLIDKAIKTVENKDKSMKLIFPAEKIKSKPNRFVCIINTENPHDFGKEIENEVRKNFKNIAKDRLQKNNCQKPQNFDEQIENFLEIYWVILPYEDESTYKDKYIEIEKLLGAIKNIRAFKQHSEDRRKCSLCGKRNALFYKKTARHKVPAFTQDDACEIRSHLFTAGEGLCAVCYTKRMYKVSKFSSVAEIALMDWLKEIPENEISTFQKCFNGDFNEDLYYDENLTEQYLKKNNINYNNIKKAKDILKKLYKTYGKPKKYYAVFMLDGDNMGKWLSGKFLVNKTKLYEFHKKTSEKLGSYADEISKLIKAHYGSLVYAGGDDVLAFVNLLHLFDVMENLRIEFPKFENQGFDIKDNHKSSASAGIAIVHYKTPLSEALKWAHRMVRGVKEQGGKDAFGIAVLKHSGEISKTLWKWDLDDERSKMKLLEDLVKKLQDDTEGFSNTFIINLNADLYKLEEFSGGMLKTELKQLLNRSSRIKGKGDEKKKKVEEWQEKLSHLYFDSYSQRKDNFLAFLNIADFLSRRIK